MADDGVFRPWQSIRDLACGHLAEVDHLLKTYVKDRDQLQGIASRELLKRIRQDEVVVLDVCLSAEFEAGRISGTRSILGGGAPEAPGRAVERP